MVLFNNIENAIIYDTTFIDSPNHNLELYVNYCEVFNVTILAPGTSPNTDAVDVHGLYPLSVA